MSRQRSQPSATSSHSRIQSKEVLHGVQDPSAFARTTERAFASWFESFWMKALSCIGPPHFAHLTSMSKLRLRSSFHGLQVERGLSGASRSAAADD